MTTLERVSRYLNKIEGAVEGLAGDGQITKIANQISHGFDLDEADTLSALMASYNPRCLPPRTEEQLRKIIGIAKGLPSSRPRGYLLNCSYPKVKAPNPLGQSTSVLKTYPFALTDLGNAEFLREVHGKELRFCENWDKWLVWADGHWRRDETGEINRRVIGLIEDMTKAAAPLASADRERMLKHVLSTQELRRLDAIPKIARSLERIAAKPEEFNRDPWLFNCQNGTIDLRSGQLKPHDRSDLITRMTPARFDPNAKCPLWDNFLLEIMNYKCELVSYLQRLFGYAMTGMTTEQILTFLYGSGANGKSTLCSTLLYVFGDYGIQAPPELLVAKRFGQGHPCDVADLNGSRLVIDSEIGEGQKLDEAKVNRLTGGDRIKARYLYADFFTFMPSHTLFICVNHKPVIRGSDLAIWRRIRLIPFSVSIDPKNQDRNLLDKLKVESSGILNWLIAGCLAWQKQGLAEPTEVTAATQEYELDSDVIARFLDECTDDTDQAARTTAAALYAAFVEWCEDVGEQVMSKNAFGRKLTDRGYPKSKNGAGQIQYRGVSLIENEGMSADHGEIDAIPIERSKDDRNDTTVEENPPDPPYPRSTQNFAELLEG